MNIPKLFLSRTTVTALAIIASVIAFNTFYTKLETEQLAAFNEWAPKTFDLLENQNPEAATKSKVSISIRLEGGEKASTWTFPEHTLADTKEREQTARVLQLINESKVFGISPASRNASGERITIAITDESTSFSTTVSAQELRSNIQIQNLLKLLEIYASTPESPVNPAQG